MLSLPPSVRIFVAREPADMRKAFDGLSALVASMLRQDPLSGHLFCFFNKRRDRIKVLWWDRSGYTLLYHRLEKGTFAVDGLRFTDQGTVEMSSSELSLLFEGIDLSRARRRPRHDIQKRSGETSAHRLTRGGGHL